MKPGDSSRPVAAARPVALRRWLKVTVSLLPLLILAVILVRLDLRQLADHVRHARWGLVLTALPLGLLVVASGAMRYRTLALRAGLSMPSLRLALAEYWRSLALGLLAPGSLGSDVYRVVAAVRRTGQAWGAAKAVVVEKAVALLACAAMAVAMLPAAAPAGLQLWGTQLQWLLGGLSAGIALLAWLTVLLWRHWRTAAALQRFQVVALSMIRRLAQQASDAAQVDPGLSMATPEAPERLALLQALAWSVAALVVSAVQAQLFFVALGLTVPMAVNLLVAPLLFITLAVPISVGGLGVRELAFVTWYGACGVPAEAALIVSTFSLASQLFSHSLGLRPWAATGSAKH